VIKPFFKRKLSWCSLCSCLHPVSITYFLVENVLWASAYYVYHYQSIVWHIFWLYLFSCSFTYITSVFSFSILLFYRYLALCVFFVLHLVALIEMQTVAGLFLQCESCCQQHPHHISSSKTKNFKYMSGESSAIPGADTFRWTSYSTLRGSGTLNGGKACVLWCLVRNDSGNLYLDMEVATGSEVSGIRDGTATTQENQLVTREKFAWPSTVITVNYSYKFSPLPSWLGRQSGFGSVWSSFPSLINGN
jgi:hypothetical protein